MLNMLINMNKITVLLGTLVFFIFLTINGCRSSKKNNKNEVVVHELADTDMLNPTNYQSANAGYILLNLYQPLISVDFKTLEPIPVLAKSRPTIEQTDDNKLLIHYEIRDEAVWDNGDPILAKDVEFSLKVIKNPKVDCHRIRPYFEFLDSIIFYEDNPKKFTLIGAEKYVLAEAISGDFSIIPKYIYDPQGLMDKFSVTELSRNGDAYANDPQIIAFADEYNSPKFQREKSHIVGSGPYALAEWQTGQRITLVKKQNWWGDQLVNENQYFEAYPSKIIYESINDYATAITALKAQKIDVMRSIPPKYFTELPASEKFVEHFNAYTPSFMSYEYIGLNLKLPKFNDKKVRQALAHLVDVDKINKTIMYGLAERVIGPVHPSKTKEYNNKIIPYTYDVELAKKLLEEAGWKDSNGNGTLDKLIDGQLVEFAIDLTYNTGNDRRQGIALVFQEAARKVGIEVTVTPQEWSVFLNNQKNHDFDMYVGGWVSTPMPQDPKQIFHTEMYNGGSNYGGFGNAETDALIERLRSELDENKRAKLWMEFQQILHDEVPYIFLMAPKERIAINKRFINAEAYVMRPGYFEAGLKTAAVK